MATKTLNTIKHKPKINDKAELNSSIVSSLNNDLPDNWKLVKLGDVVKVNMGQSPESSTYNDNGDGLPFFQGKAEFTELSPKVVKWCSKPLKIAEPNDILLCVRAPVGDINLADTKCCIGRGLAALTFKNYKYLYYYLKLKQKELDSKGTGTTFKSISGNIIKDTLFPLPPENIQKAIVSKIEELFTEVDNGIKQLKEAQEQLKLFKQSVLKEAFIPKDGEVWDILKLKDVCDIINGKNQSKVVNPNGKYPIYGSAGIMGYADDFLCNEECTIVGKKGNINSPIFVQTKFWNVDTAFGLSPNKNINSKLLYFFCLGFNFKALDKSTTIPSLSKSDLLQINLSIPPLSQQQKIVDQIENKFEVAKQMEEALSVSLKEAELLKQSILKQAFEGKLIK